MYIAHFVIYMVSHDFIFLKYIGTMIFLYFLIIYIGIIGIDQLKYTLKSSLILGVLGGLSIPFKIAK